jgi:hypothetical protein
LFIKKHNIEKKIKKKFKKMENNIEKKIIKKLIKNLNVIMEENSLINIKQDT